MTFIYLLFLICIVVILHALCDSARILCHYPGASFLFLQAARGVKLDVELTAEDLKELVQRYKAVYNKNGAELPHDPMKQLEMSICAVFRSWNAPRAGKNWSQLFILCES